MRVLWAPWRMSYVSAATQESGCIFCDKPALDEPAGRRQALVLYSDRWTSVMINRFPYASAHLMVAPRRHTAELEDVEPELGARVHATIGRAVLALRAEYRPQGFNVGLNLGSAAGAGIADHLHWHIVPRWEGDTNFMPVLGDTKVMPEHLDETFERLVAHFEAGDG